VTEYKDLFGPAELRLFLEKIKPDEKYNDYLRGKRVAIVGPSKHMLAYDAGSVIDEYDVVIRMKWVDILPLSEHCNGKYVKHIGSKTDVVYGNRFLIVNNMMQEYLEYFKRSEIDHYRIPDNKVSNHFFSKELACGTTYTEYACGDFGLQYQSITQTDGTRYWPQTGTVAIMEAIASDAAEIFVSGITMYHGGGHIFQKNKNPTHNQPIVGKHHGVLETAMLIDCYELSENRGKIRFDEPLYNIMNMYKQGLATKEITKTINEFVNKLE